MQTEAELIYYAPYWYEATSLPHTSRFKAIDCFIFLVYFEKFD